MSSQDPASLPRRRLLATAALALALPDAQATVSPLQLVSYYDYPPFVTTPGQGLSHDLLQWLKQHVGGASLEQLPRRRVDARIAEASWNGIVLWVAPSWFGGPSDRRFEWSEPLMDDEDLVLSRKARPVAFEDIRSLRGLTLGGVFGHVYRDADPLVQRGEMRRLDSFSQEANLRLLMRGRVDAIFLSRSGLGWWRRRIADFDQQIEIAAQPRLRYQRHVMLSRQLQAEQRQALLEGVGRLRASTEWREMLQRYEIRTADHELLNTLARSS